MAGTSLLMKSLPPVVCEAAYTSVLQCLGLEDLLATDRVKVLLSMPIEAFHQKVSPAIPLIPAIDGELIHGMVDCG